MTFTAVNDNSKQKKERRRTVYKEIRRSKARNILATNYPESQGRKFVFSKLVQDLRVKLTLAERKSFSRDSKKELGKVATLVPHTDVFFQMLSNSYDFLDLDLCGGLAEDDAKSIISCTSWKTIIITVTNRLRSKFQRQSANGNVHIQTWMMNWCEKNGWNCKLVFSPKPYQRPNKRALMGIPDRRSPWYFTFIITR